MGLLQNLGKYQKKEDRGEKDRLGSSGMSNLLDEKKEQILLENPGLSKETELNEALSLPLSMEQNSNLQDAAALSSTTTTVLPSSNSLDMASIRASIKKKLHHGNTDKAFIPSQLQTQSLLQQRVCTGIPGLDQVMEGGLLSGSVTLIGGGAGCGKSILGMQFLVQGVEQYNEPGIYLSFEETPTNIFRDFYRFSWNIEQKIKDKKLTILSYTPEQVAKVLESGGGTVRDAIESIGAKRLVLDSLTAFTLLHETELAKRKAVLKLAETLASWGITALLIAEQEPDPERHLSTIAEFQTDGVILLYNIRKGDIRERSLEIFKMRGVKHAAKIFPMRIDERGITIYPEETIF
ncbi:hypothetical protein HYW21_03025 [Candidatus Woesearchaeota archaeon]|nr:hypothetical protein [Candidatus Woesearchaeota archaeon]